MMTRPARPRTFWSVPITADRRIGANVPTFENLRQERRMPYAAIPKVDVDVRKGRPYACEQKPITVEKGAPGFWLKYIELEGREANHDQKGAVSASRELHIVPRIGPARSSRALTAR